MNYMKCIMITQLAPEKLKINHDMLSNYCSNIANDHGVKIGSVNE